MSDRASPEPETIPTPERIEEIERAAARLESAPAGEVIAWAIEESKGNLAVAASFQDAVLVDLAAAADPGIEVIFLDTGYHFPETLAYVERLRKRYDLNLKVAHPAVPLGESVCGSKDCCALRKVAPLAAALAGRRAWVTGLKRVDTPERADAPVVAWDPGRSMLKVNPLATWSDDDVDDYTEAMDLPRHPLTYAGYVSIGCAPTTSPVAPGQNPREGRWAGTGKTECGLHL